MCFYHCHFSAVELDSKEYNYEVRDDGTSASIAIVTRPTMDSDRLALGRRILFQAGRYCKWLAQQSLFLEPN